MAEHGTRNSYNLGCRCEDCRRAERYYRRGPLIDRAALRDLLAELFPLGLTDDCPARKKAAARPPRCHAGP